MHSPEQKRKMAEALADASKNLNVVGQAPKDLTNKPEVHPGKVKEDSLSESDFKNY